MRRLILLAAAMGTAAFLGCGDDEVKGADGINSLITSAAEPAGDNCENGGTRFDYGADANGDGELGPDEIQKTEYACNGADGSNGEETVTLVVTSAEAPGANCAAGGQRVDFGIDDNGDGILDAVEVDGTAFVCDGTDGLESLVSASTEAPGANCIAGGTRIDGGTDTSNDGVLDQAEITTTGFVCNGLQSLIVSSTEAPGGACGALAGSRTDMGLDLDNDGALAADEITTTAFVCDGADGVNGFEALVVQTAIAAGGVCGTATGVQVASGLDLDRSGVLDADEIANSEVLCNGADGANGDPGGPGLISLILLTPEPAGGNCFAGGTRIESGVDTDSSGVLENGEVTQTGFACNVPGTLPFATAQIRTNTKRAVFLFAAAGTAINSHAEYADYCRANGFEQNQNSNAQDVYANAGNFNAVDFYCEEFCCYLGDGNSQALQLADFQNFGLPLTSELRVFDRGCGDRLGDYATALVTNDRLDVPSATTFTYTPSNYGPADHSTSSVTTLDRDGVVLCQEL